MSSGKLKLIYYKKKRETTHYFLDKQIIFNLIPKCRIMYIYILYMFEEWIKVWTIITAWVGGEIMRRWSRQFVSSKRKIEMGKEQSLMTFDNI